MIRVQKFTFFPEAFAENTFVVSDDSKNCVVIDPGCYHRHEKLELAEYIEDNGFTLEKILLTHCHLDHIMGNAFLMERFNVPLFAHSKDLYNMRGAPMAAGMYGIRGFEPSPEPTDLLDDLSEIGFGNTTFEILFTPGHCRGHVSFFDHESRSVFSGDVLFRGSVGRTDLPGGDAKVLLNSIENVLYPLGDDVKVYSGHMGDTTIGHEKATNMVVNSLR